MSYLEELDEKPLDVPFTTYHNLDIKNLDVEMSFIVNKKLPDSDEMKAEIIFAGKCVTICIREHIIICKKRI